MNTLRYNISYLVIDLKTIRLLFYGLHNTKKILKYPSPLHHHCCHTLLRRCGIGRRREWKRCRGRRREKMVNKYFSKNFFWNIFHMFWKVLNTFHVRMFYKTHSPRHYMCFRKFVSKILFRKIYLSVFYVFWKFCSQKSCFKNFI